MNYLKIIDNFSQDNLPTLDVITMGALELLSNSNIKKLDINYFKKPLVAGSGNALVTAKIIFGNTNAIFCDETNFDQQIERQDIDGLIILSASGEKHAAIFAKKSTEKSITTKLLTCNNHSTAGNIIGSENVIITPKNREPYTYNTSTYLGWVLAITGENPRSIKKFIEEKINPKLQNYEFTKFDSFLLITPDDFSGVNQLFIVKFIELFGRKVARDVFSYEHLKHAITVVENPKELCITFGDGELFYDGNIFSIPLPKDCSIGTMMTIGYYTIGKIQSQFPDYFKHNIGKYMSKMNKTKFGKNLKIIVE